MRKKLINILSNAHNSYYSKFDPSADYFGALADGLIANGVTVQKWISVTERLPENKSCILMYSADGGVAEGIYDKEQKRWIQFRWSVLNVPSVTHWMPLPQPPKGE